MKQYDPSTVSFASFAKARAQFSSASVSPRTFLEQCIEQISELESDVKAFVGQDLSGAREAADAASARWKNGQQLSAIDGMPYGVKDCYHVSGHSTVVNSPVFRNAQPELIDAAHVDALRRSGSALLGKTTTTEWTMALPAPTCNPWDYGRTPGGSSSGSAAGVAAGMFSVGTGSQVRGSGIRPASICGIPAFKPTFGALNRHGGIDPTPSLNHLAILGASLTDIWDVSREISAKVGGDPGYPRLICGDTLPNAHKPKRLARQYTIGWDKTDAKSQAVFESWLSELSADGIEIVEPDKTPELAAYEEATLRTIEWFFHLMYEVIWPLSSLRAAAPDDFSHIMHGHIDKAEALEPEDYARANASRERLRKMHRALRGEVDGFVTLSHIGPGQEGHPEVGTPWYNDASSAIGAPTMNLPLLSVDNLPVGIQLMGFENEDAQIMGIGRWLIERLNYNLT